MRFAAEHERQVAASARRAAARRQEMAEAGGQLVDVGRPERVEVLTDADQMVAGIIEADLPPVNVDGMDSPAMLLMEFQREARSHFTAEVAYVLVDVLLQVEQGTGQCAVCAPFLWRPGVLERRRVIERAFQLQLREQVQAVRPPWMTRRDSVSARLPNPYLTLPTLTSSRFMPNTHCIHQYA